MVDAGGLPVAGVTTPADVHEVRQLVPLVDAAGPQHPDGGPIHRPAELYADRAYDSEPHREQLRTRGINPHLAKPGRRTGAVWACTGGWSNAPSPGSTGSAN